jgi:hypothetical protein
MTTPDGPAKSSEPLLTTRATVVLLLAGLVGLGTFLLTYFGGRAPTEAMLASAAAAGAAAALFNGLVGP